MGCEGPKGYDPATEIAKRMGTTLPDDFHCKQEKSLNGNDTSIFTGSAEDREIIQPNISEEEEEALLEASRLLQQEIIDNSQKDYYDLKNNGITGNM